MANRQTFWFTEVLLKEDLNTEFDNLEAADWAAAADFGQVGIVTGGLASVSVSLAQANLTAIVARSLDGKRLVTSAPATVDFTDDVLGNPTIPSSGHFRWITILARYGKSGTAAVTDGDSLTVYTLEAEGISSTGDVDVAHTPGNFGQFRIVSGTEAASTGAAVRPTGFGNDVVICDLLLDDTGKVHGGIAGASTTRATRFVLTQSGAPMFSPTRYDASDYALIRDVNLDDQGVLHYREYVGFNGAGTYSFLQTINAKWDGVNQVWSCDNAAGAPAQMTRMSGNAFFRLVRQDPSVVTWLDTYNDSAGWDTEVVLSMSAANSKLTIDSAGEITATGAQIAFGVVRFLATDSSSHSVGNSVTWPQEMAATPSSTTLTDISSIDQNLLQIICVAANKYGSEVVATCNTGLSAGNNVVGARKIVANP